MESLTEHLDKVLLNSFLMSSVSVCPSLNDFSIHFCEFVMKSAVCVVHSEAPVQFGDWYQVCLVENCVGLYPNRIISLLPLI